MDWAQDVGMSSLGNLNLRIQGSNVDPEARMQAVGWRQRWKSLDVTGVFPDTYFDGVFLTGLCVLYPLHQ